jgi:hypothetical protein
MHRMRDEIDRILSAWLTSLRTNAVPDRDFVAKGRALRRLSARAARRRMGREIRDEIEALFGVAQSQKKPSSAL